MVTFYLSHAALCLHNMLYYSFASLLQYAIIIFYSLLTKYICFLHVYYKSTDFFRHSYSTVYA